jgi:hypothetical protein
MVNELYQMMDISRELGFDSWMEQFLDQTLVSRLNSGLLGSSLLLEIQGLKTIFFCRELEN